MAERDLELALMRLAWRLDALDEWRHEVEQELGVMESKVEALSETQKIADAVAKKLGKEQRRENMLSLTWYQKAGALVAGAIILADSLRGLVQ